jgi:toxin ParE1/3/4
VVSGVIEVVLRIRLDRYTDDIRDTCYTLASGKIRGRAVDVRPGYLKYLVGSHIIYFRDRDNQLEIVRILHSMIDVNHYL